MDILLVVDLNASIVIPWYQIYGGLVACIAVHGQEYQSQHILPWRIHHVTDSVQDSLRNKSSE